MAAAEPSPAAAAISSSTPLPGDAPRSSVEVGPADCSARTRTGDSSTTHTPANAAIANAQRQPSVSATVGTATPDRRVAVGIAACLTPKAVAR
ncbi:hypothetical protein G9447_11365 [Actinopolyspora sp. BKK1]|nr:hypothetical protein [Actinopolyspora sp. BKK2]NHE76800.1 hypothetical protein [Actinopolyspora sp. BKK1]